MINITLLQEKPSVKIFFILFSVAFLLRACSFYFYVQHEERYCQADSQDYHFNTLGLALGKGMVRIDNNEPLFWRTPGYPLYLSFFYHLFGLKNFTFSANSLAQKVSIWFQIFLCSLLPLLIFILAFTISKSYSVAWGSAIISVIHIGFILASNYLLTDALSMLFFVSFLIYFYKSFERLEDNNLVYVSRLIIFAAIFLAVYTWIRPMGQFVAAISAILLLAAQVNFKKRIISIIVFSLVFMASISPWYIRNYQLTGSLFFCPLFGPYLTVFSAPKIKSKVEGISLEESHKILSYQGGRAAQEAINKSKASRTNKKVCTELACLKVALPWIINYPIYFLKDWIQEVIKTTFDLYSSQLVAFAANSYKWDPLIEYLDQKILACLYKQSMPISMRIICWLEFIWTLLLWFGIFSGTWQFLIKPLVNREILTPQKKKLLLLWLITSLLIIATVGITGGFGYARLRLPIEPLMIILTLIYYNWALESYRIKNKQRNIEPNNSNLIHA